MMRCFGPRWAHGVFPRVEAPVGTPCLSCGMLIVKDDQGAILPVDGHKTETVMHRACLIKEIKTTRASTAAIL